MDINLLPSSESAYAKYHTDLIVMLFGIILPVAIMIYWWQWIQTDISEIEGKMIGYHEEITSYEKLSGATTVMAEKNDDASVQATRRIWRSFAAISGRSVCLSEISRSKNKLTLTGKAQSIADIEKMSAQLSASDLYGEINLIRLEDVDGVYRYKIRAIQKTELL